MHQMSLANSQNTSDWDGPSAPNWPLAPSRVAGLDRLAAFVAKGGRDYQTHRNTDRGEGRHSHVSVLSPYLRHRMIDETEVLGQILDQHSPNEAFKFVQEVFWRSYWKGWLEHRSLLWPSHQHQLPACLEHIQANPRCFDDYQRAIAGETSIVIFNEWCHELKRTGYLHNHARMWFASIWVFTLRLPWELGADFFIRHLMDGDPGEQHIGLALGCWPAHGRQDLLGDTAKHSCLCRGASGKPKRSSAGAQSFGVDDVHCSRTPASQGSAEDGDSVAGSGGERLFRVSM
jgi:deoxyribodipyrimidine photolyase